MAVAASSNSVVDTLLMRIVRLLRVTTYVRSAAAKVPRNAHRRKYDPICIVHPQYKLYNGFLSICKQTLMATARFG